MLRFKQIRVKKPILDLFKKSFPNIPVEDFEISWSYRSVIDSLGFWKDDTLIGFVLASYHTRSGESLYIDYFAIDEPFRGQGIGTQILKDFFAEFKGSVHLVPENEGLIHWYTRNGFVESNKGYYVRHGYLTRSRDTVLRTQS